MCLHMCISRDRQVFVEQVQLLVQTLSYAITLSSLPFSIINSMKHENKYFSCALLYLTCMVEVCSNIE